MTDHKGRRYECAVPPANPPTDDTSAAKVGASMAVVGCATHPTQGLLEQAIEGKSPLDLLETLGASYTRRNTLRNLLGTPPPPSH